MAEEIAMPRLGWTLEEGTLVEWLKAEGDQVEVGEILFTVESDKALNEIETFSGSILCIPPDAPQPGDTVPVGTLLGYLLEPGETMPVQTQPAEPTPMATSSQKTDPHSAPSTHPTSPSPATATTDPAISPRARRIAAELGLDWHQIKGSGRTGRIVERDIRAASAKAPSPSGRVRELIARRLEQSQRETVAVTLTTEADATELVDLRTKLKIAQGATAPTFNHLFAKLSAIALGEHPLVNSSWQDGQTHLHSEIHLSIAVDTEDGLLTPVIRNAATKSLNQIAAEARDLALKARRRTLNPTAMQGGTFTITNLGIYGIDAFTPVINLPQAAILGLGRIIEKPAVYQGQVVPRALITLSLTFDHRILDGGPAANFLDRVRTFIEDPALWLEEEH